LGRYRFVIDIASLKQDMAVTATQSYINAAPVQGSKLIDIMYKPKFENGTCWYLEIRFHAIGATRSPADERTWTP
jgi:hypothetical protein